jgi:hypothetical protein
MKFIVSLLVISMFAACGDDATIVGVVGDECLEATECEQGICITVLGEGGVAPIVFDGGYCSSECYYDEDLVSHGCGENEICLRYDADYFDDIPEVDYCFASGCETDWDCRDDNYICVYFFVDNFEVGTCIPAGAG